MRICHVNLARGYRGGERQTELLIRELVKLHIPQRAVVRKGEELAQRLHGISGVELKEIQRPYLLSVSVGYGHIVHAHEAKAAHFAHECHLLTGSPYLLTRRINRPPSRGWLTRQVYRRAAAVVGVAGAVAEGLHEYDTTLRPHVIHSAMAQLTADANVANGLRQKWPGRFLVGHAGALDNSQKGQVHLIRAVRCLTDKYPDLQLVLLGSGKDEAWFRREAAGSDRISFEGYVRNVGDYLSIFDVFVLPSIHEGIGGVLLDAMSFGVPVIASAVDGLPEIVTDGHNGLLVAPADEYGLAQAIRRMHDDPELCRRLGAVGREVAARHEPPAMAASYLQLYQDISGTMIPVR